MTAKARKPTTTRRATRRRAPAPLGLRMLFSALEPDGWEPGFGTALAERYQDVPHAILDAQDAGAIDYKDVVFTITNRQFKGNEYGPDDDQPASNLSEYVAMPSFWAGVATAWHVLNAINGKGGAR